MKINLTLWNEARSNIESALRAQKRLIRREYQGRADAKDWSDLRRLKDQATRLYAIRATSRGGDHAGHTEEPAEFALA